MDGGRIFEPEGVLLKTWSTMESLRIPLLQRSFIFFKIFFFIITIIFLILF